MDSMGGKDVFSTNGAVIISMRQKKKNLSPHITPVLLLQTHSSQYYKLSVTNPFYRCCLYKVAERIQCLTLGRSPHRSLSVK